MVICYGKDNLIQSMEIIEDAGFEDCLGLADADFERVAGEIFEQPNIIKSRTHDFDLDAACCNVFERYLYEVGDEGKLRNLGGCDHFRLDLMSRIKPLSSMRFAIIKHDLRFKIENLKYEKFYDGEAVDVEALINHVLWGKNATPEIKKRLGDYIQRYSAADFELLQLTNGHDFFSCLGISLREKIGNRKDLQTLGSEVELHMRLAFTKADLKETGLLDKIIAWERSAKLCILSNHAQG